MAETMKAVSRISMKYFPFEIQKNFPFKINSNRQPFVEIYHFTVSGKGGI